MDHWSCSIEEICYFVLKQWWSCIQTHLKLKSVQVMEQVFLTKAEYVFRNITKVCLKQVMRIYTCIHTTLRLIPEGYEVPRVLIHLLFWIFHRHGSRLRIWSITMTAMSANECASPLKCCATGDSSVLRCVMSYRIYPAVYWLSRLPYVLLTTPPAFNIGGLAGGLRFHLKIL